MWPGDPAADEDSLPPIEALTLEPPADPANVRGEMNRLLGVGVRRVRYEPPDRSDVSCLPEEMGL